ncbi:alpha-E domain-containing protein [Marinobacter caseinilyticus]|uniref:alpha-E domain-containing protein n=1 Tax=Marinobacter caseinilyticus TaxID=2692195 RepID=UPI00140836F1|nr:alpha-E domain-containing protein [Marinobacter caseinilyticus]
MLSRAASSLFWMARYLERAENQARLLDISLTMALIDVPEDREEQLSVPLLVTGSQDTFNSLYDELNPQNLITFVLLDDRNPGSVYNIFRIARDNALQVRGNLSADVWESINLSWLEFRELRQQGVTESSASQVFDWTRARSHEFRGAAYGTLLRNDAFRFLRLGTFIERADTTARMLNIRQQLALLPENDQASRPFFEWNALLHSLAAYEAYQTVYGHNIDPLNVAELLVLNPDVPRSLHACLQAIAELLEAIEGDRGRRAKRLATSLYSNIRYGDRDYIAEHGLDKYLADFLTRIQRIAAQIQNDYMGWQT